MSLKVKLTSTICAFLLILGLVITGVFAVPQATVNLGGTLTFKASDVYARVTGTITGSKEDPTLTPIEFNAGSASDTSTWTNNLAFKDDGSTITITINVENLATDRPLYVSMTDSVGFVENITKSLTNGAFELAAGEDATATITMEVTDKNASLSGATYGYLIELLDESAVQSYDTVEGITLTCDTDARTASVTGNSLSEATDLVIPAYVKSGEVVCAVTSIGSNVFYNCSNLKSLVIPNTVISIEFNAFRNCTSLKKIQIPNSVTSIEESAFQGCSGFNSIEIPEGVTSIANSTFYGCVSLRSIELPETLTSIGNSAFSGCYSSLKNIELPDGVLSIGNSAFSGCWALESIEMPSSLTTIGESAFNECTSLKSIVIPANVSNIALKTFYGCTDLEKITIGNGVSSIDTTAFDNCTSLTEVIVDSEAIASKLTTDRDYSTNTYPVGALLNYATTIYVKTDIVSSLNSYVTTSYTNVETITSGEYAGYTCYSK